MIWKCFILISFFIFLPIVEIGSSDFMENKSNYSKHDLSEVILFLCGDVMPGRGIDQILPYSVGPKIYESYVKDATIYVRLAEKVNGPVDYPVSYKS